MADEKQTNLVEAGTSPSAEGETPKIPETKVYTEAEVKVILAEKEKVEKQISGLHKELSKKDLKLKEAQELHSRLDSLELGLATLFDKLEKPVDEFEAVEEKSKTRETYQQAQQRKQQDREVQRLANQFTEEATEAGLTEAERKEIMFSTRSYEEAQLKLRERLMDKEKIKVKYTEAEQEKKIQERVEAEVRRRLAESGVLKVETSGSPAGTGKTYTREQIAGMSVSEYEKEQSAIKEAQKAGRIK